MVYYIFGIPGSRSFVVNGKVQFSFFEPKVSSTLLDFKLYHQYFIYLSFIKDIVEEFNLNRRIWSKGAPLPVFSQNDLKKMIANYSQRE
jgi:hypothetical protein